jgi:peptide deformylase
MTKLEIKKYGDPILRKKTNLVLEINKDIKCLAKDMLETMYLADGVGLAAPQIGILLRLCVIDISPEGKSPLVMINPKITYLGGGKVSEQEGCLSFPGIFAKIRRFSNVKAEYTDLEGENKEIEAQGLLSRAIQHETDHLDAKLFIDYAHYFKRKSIERAVRKRRKTGNW